MSTTAPPAAGSKRYGPESWQYKLVDASQRSSTPGQRSKLNILVLAVIGKSPAFPPRIMGAATIEPDGRVWTPFQAGDGTVSIRAPFCHVDEIITNMRGLADAAQLDDRERAEMAAEIRRWIKLDKRRLTYKED